MSECDCSEDYGPCEDHCTVLVQREGASTRTAHESAVQYAQDAADLLDEIGGAVEGVRDIDREVLVEAWEMLEANRRMGVAWFPGDDGDEMLDTILRVGDALGSDLSALGYFTFSEDGYWIVKIHEDCPLLDD